MAMTPMYAIFHQNIEQRFCFRHPNREDLPPQRPIPFPTSLIQQKPSGADRAGQRRLSVLCADLGN